MPQLNTKRLFLAVEIPKEIQNTLETLENILKQSDCDIRWVKPANIHLTLKFLGAVETQYIETLAKTTISCLQSTQSFDVSLDKLCAFPSINTPHILWMGINDKDERIKKIALRLEDSLNNLGFTKEEKKFQTHLTLARLRSDRNKLNLIEKIREINETMQPKTCLIDNITLFESLLAPKGPIYTQIHQVKLLSC